MHKHTGMQSVCCIFILLLAGYPLCMLAEGVPYSYHNRYIDVRTGLCDNAVRALLKDSRSFVWIGTGNGLDRYDGYEFRHYSTLASQPWLFVESNYINDLAEDPHDGLWIASEAGVARIDLTVDSTTFFKSYNGPLKEALAAPTQALLADEAGQLWAAQRDGLLYLRTDSLQQVVEVRRLLQGVDIRCLARVGNAVYAAGAGCLYRFEGARPHYPTDLMAELFPDAPHGITCTALYPQGTYLWIGSTAGICCYNLQTRTCLHYRHRPGDASTLLSDEVTDLAENRSGDLVIGTRAGIDLYTRSGHFVHLSQQGERHGEATAPPIVNRLLVDDDDNIWVGTHTAGVSLLSPQAIRFHYLLQGESHLVSCVLQDDDGNLLVGLTDGGLAIRLHGEERFLRYRHQSGVAASLAHDNVSDIVQTPDGNYWIATLGGGVDLLPKALLRQPRFTHFHTGNSGLLADEVYDLFTDSVHHALWLCTSHHIQQIDPQTHSIGRLQCNLPGGGRMENMETLFIDSQSRLWIGGNGLYVVHLDDGPPPYRCTWFPHKLDAPGSQINEKITCIGQTRDGSLYLGSLGHGLYLLEPDSLTGAPATYRFRNFGARNGLSDASISAIVPDEAGRLWLSTTRGICCFDIHLQRAFRLDQDEGLLATQFCRRAACRTAASDILLGSTDGVVSFAPLLSDEPPAERTVLPVGLWCDGVEITPTRHPDCLPAAIHCTDQIHLYPPQRSFELVFASPAYTGQQKIYYAHWLQGWEQHPSIGLGRRVARYSNLSPGRYTLDLCCTNADTGWSSRHRYLTVVVHPAFYQTLWFRILLWLSALLLPAAVVYIYLLRQQRQRRLLQQTVEDRTQALRRTIASLQQSQAIIERQNGELMDRNREISRQRDELEELSRRMEAVNREKLSYFTNLAHDFKTPLTLIEGPVSRLLQQTTDRNTADTLRIVRRNAGYLLSLVHQLVDLHRIDTGHITLQPRAFDLLQLLRQVADDFASSLQQRHITFALLHRLADPHLATDPDHLHKVLFNLLSNACKYTPRDGHITLYAALLPVEEPSRALLYLSVANSGSYIPPHEQERIFTRFYRLPAPPDSPHVHPSGSGIGLHIVQGIVTRMGGTLRVSSRQGCGTAFRLLLPVQKASSVQVAAAAPLQLPAPLLVEVGAELPSAAPPPFVAQHRGLPILLLVEDHPDMRRYVRSLLEERFNVAEAVHGADGLQMALRLLPDFIVADLMMPVMDGCQLLQRVRADARLSHIPFLLLTAHSADSARLEAYGSGADGYVTKPFEPSLLLARIDAICRNRALCQQRFAQAPAMEPDLLQVGQTDRQFMDQVLQLLEQHYADSAFGVQQLCDGLHLGYHPAYKKLVALTGMPPVRFLLLYRLQVAHRLLQSGKEQHLVVADVAYATGFSDPKYFTRCYVKHYGRKPSDYLK